MKGAIANCVKETIVSKFGNPKWEEIMIASGLNAKMTILVIQDIDDDIILNVVENSCKILDLSIEQIADYFGDYWMNSYAVNMYKPYYGTNSTAKDFFLKLNTIHSRVTNSIPNAKPPRFEYDWENENTLILTYISPRGLIDFVVGLAKGVGNYFNQKLSVRKISSTKVEIIFL
ncbi:MAG TPA: heme NO-binding domain-containing protein [Prolixibacteraceae bacterium]|nr:heme NO-binding domain-containing protein [Prolixibacteraceae bacterium]